MKSSQPAVVVGGNVSGNIGQCQINTTDVSLNSFYMETIAINSCTGQIVADNSYFNWGPVLFVVCVLVFVGFFIAPFISSCPRHTFL